MREYSIGKRLVEGYLHQPYSWYLNRNSSDLGKTILSEVGIVIVGGILPLMTLMTQSVVAFALLALLLIVEPLLAILVGMVLSISYIIIFTLMGRKLNKLGQDRIQANQDRFLALSEAFGAIKEIKLGRLEQAYVEKFATPAEIYAKGQASSQLIGQLPRYIFEAIAFGGMLLVMLTLMARSRNFSDVLPIIALYAFAGYRIMPALQQLYGAFTQLKFAAPAINALHADLLNLNQMCVGKTVINKIEFKKDIELNQITYHYPNPSKFALNGINLRIPFRSTIGFVGETGSGKTTVVDIVLGLLEPESGTLTIDGQLICSKNRHQWQQVIGYVPQNIYLSDDTIGANIAFGVNKEFISQQDLERAAKIANLHDFIINELPLGYQTPVGERGVRLSGGQRQRIGIARALYHKPQVLILDEATSALDNITERAVTEAIKNVGNELTIIMIAHRLTTICNCDQIYLFERGKVKDFGSYSELISRSSKFAEMVNKT
jgi:ABC-type bacteriocin/lantibiotic exporter with double-glycine peptidase domain